MYQNKPILIQVLNVSENKHQNIEGKLNACENRLKDTQNNLKFTEKQVVYLEDPVGTSQLTTLTVKTTSSGGVDNVTVITLGDRVGAIIDNTCNLLEVYVIYQKITLLSQVMLSQSMIIGIINNIVVQKLTSDGLWGILLLLRKDGQLLISTHQVLIRIHQRLLLVQMSQLFLKILK